MKRALSVLLIVFMFLNFSCTLLEREYKPGTILFQDALNGIHHEGWIIPPDNFVNFMDGQRAYFLKATPKDSFVLHPWAGDKSWKNYRFEIEFMIDDQQRSGFIGFQFHVQKDIYRSYNIGFYTGGDLSSQRFVETTRHWNKRNLSWKLWPFSQKSFYLETGRWIPLRIDVGENMANVYLDGNDVPAYTTYDLPYASGGVRFWQYGGSVYLRNMKVTALAKESIMPILQDPYSIYMQSNILREWEITPLMSPNTDSRSLPASLSDSRMSWKKLQGDRRGVVDVNTVYPENQDRKVIFARSMVFSQERRTVRFFYSYTDQMSIWCNGVKVIDCEPRGFADPGRSATDGFGRVLPDLFDVEIALGAGENEILISLEINEPAFGCGWWMRY